MSERRPLAIRRAELIALCAVQRDDLAFAATGVERSLWLVDAAVAASRRMAARPALLAGIVVVAVIVLRPGRVLRLLSWGLPVVLTARRGVAAWLQRPHRAALEP